MLIGNGLFIVHVPRELQMMWKERPRNKELRNGKRFNAALVAALELASGDRQASAELLVPGAQLLDICYSHVL